VKAVPKLVRRLGEAGSKLRRISATAGHRSYYIAGSRKSPLRPVFPPLRSANRTGLCCHRPIFKSDSPKDHHHHVFSHKSFGQHQRMREHRLVNSPEWAERASDFDAVLILHMYKCAGPLELAFARPSSSPFVDILRVPYANAALNNRPCPIC
jgi:hypothetical protein